MRFLTVIVALLVAAICAAAFRKLTIFGALAGFGCGYFIYIGAGIPGILMLGAFFILGTAATYWQKDRKALPGTHAVHQSKRSAAQVLANGGVAALLAIPAPFLPPLRFLFVAMLAGSLASALADTLSSELGVVYGRRFYDLLSRKPSPPGPDGVVSLEGALAGVAGAAIIAGIFAWQEDKRIDALLEWRFYVGFWPRFVSVFAAGIIGNFTDSLLGATLERKGRIGNNFVNFMNTFTGAIAAGLLILLFNNVHI